MKNIIALTLDRRVQQASCARLFFAYRQIMTILAAEVRRYHRISHFEILMEATMFNTKSDYALNKLDREAIVCKTASGAYIRLTCADFASPEEFMKWKAFSDQDYHDTEAQQQDDEHCLSLDERTDASVPSAEEHLLSAIGLSDKGSANGTARRRIKSILTEAQYRRLLLNIVGGKTTREIATLEGASQQAVSQSIVLAKKKIFRHF